MDFWQAVDGGQPGGDLFIEAATKAVASDGSEGLSSSREGLPDFDVVVIRAAYIWLLRRRGRIIPAEGDRLLIELFTERGQLNAMLEELEGGRIGNHLEE